MIRWDWHVGLYHTAYALVCVLHRLGNKVSKVSELRECQFTTRDLLRSHGVEMTSLLCMQEMAMG